MWRGSCRVVGGCLWLVVSSGGFSLARFSIGGLEDFEVEDDSVCLGLGNALDVRVHEENVSLA